MPSEKRQIARAAGVVGVLTLFSRMTGLIRDVVISYLFGAGTAAEAFFVAFRFPNLFRRLVAEGAMSVAFVPVFSDLLVNRPRDAAEQALRALLGVSAFVLIALSIIGAVLAPLWVDVFAPGFGSSPDLRELAIELTRLLFPYLPLIGLVAVMAGFLNATRHFMAPALSPAVLNLVIIGCALTLYRYLEEPVYALAYGVVLGGVCQLSLQIAILLRRGVRIVPTWRPRDEGVGRIGRLLVPATFGTAIFQINVLIGTMLASMLPVGSVAYLWYADRVFEFPLGLFVAALGTAALPSMASQASRNEYRELGESLGFTIGLVNFISIPATVGLVVLAEPITAVLFERGAFGEHETAMTARALQYYAIGLWSVSGVRLLAPAFYALGDARTPVATGCIAVLVNVLMSLALMGPVSTEGAAPWLAGLINAVTIADLDHAGLALATSMAATVNLLALGWLLRRRLGRFDVDAIFGSLVRSVTASVPMALAVMAVSYMLAPWFAGGSLSRALALTCTIGMGGAIFAIAGFLWGGPEIEGVKRLVLQRWPAGASRLR